MIKPYRAVISNWLSKIFCFWHTFRPKIDEEMTQSTAINNPRLFERRGPIIEI